MNQKIKSIFEGIKEASRKAHKITDKEINAVLKELADVAIHNIRFLLSENEKDLERMSPDNPKYDRLKLTEERIRDIAKDLVNVSSLSTPLGKVLESRTLVNGLKLQKVSVPLGVIGVIYEARPNVTFDVFSLCFKSGNACILKGGRDAEYSNKAIMKLITEVLVKHKINQYMVQLLPSDREVTEELLGAEDYVDVIIPRGSQSLINFVREYSKVPVIETGAGIVHTYFDETADVDQGAKIIHNAKTRRVSVCNALDCLIIHHSRLNTLSKITESLKEYEVAIYADQKAYFALKNTYPESLLHLAEEEHFGTEFLDYKMAIKTVNGLDGALDHIAQHSSKHSEAILSESPDNIQKFFNAVDASAVYANASTAYTDGAQFGLGAEIGISTQKLHARGPMGLDELTSYKWLVEGNGHYRK